MYKHGGKPVVDKLLRTAADKKASVPSSALAAHSIKMPVLCLLAKEMNTCRISSFSTWRKVNMVLCTCWLMRLNCCLVQNALNL